MHSYIYVYMLYAAGARVHSTVGFKDSPLLRPFPTGCFSKSSGENSRVHYRTGKNDLAQRVIERIP